MSKNSNKLYEAIAEIGLDEKSREEILAVLKGWEARNSKMGVEVRETVTGYIVDALYQNVGAVTKKLQNAMVMTLPYRSKIARDFAMAETNPDHVWEPQTTKLLLKLAETGKQMLVGGAYAGDQAVLVAKKLTDNNGYVHCFEPNTEQSAALLKNAVANDVKNIAVSNDGLWNVKGWLKLEGSDSHACPVEAKQDEVGSFPTNTIDDYCDANSVDKLDIIMLDIEGGEFKALQGGEKRLRQPAGQAPDIVMEIHSSYTDWSNGLDGTDVLTYLQKLGYKTYAIRDYQSNMAMNGAPIELVPTNDIYIAGPHHGFNILASKKDNILGLLQAKLVNGVSPKLLKHRDPELHQPKYA